MSRIKIVLVCLIVLSPSICPAEEGSQRDSLQLTLPSEFYAVPGVDSDIYFDNIVLTKTPEAYRFDVKCDLGQVESRRWTITPDDKDVGVHELAIHVSTPDGKQLASASMRLRVIPADAGAGREINLLIVGDSLTHATQYPNEIARLLSQPANPDWRMFGTHKPKGSKSGVAHEGYGGWTWQRFASHYEPKPDGTYRKRSSPFVYLTDEGKPKLDVERYLEKECDGRQPDFVVFMLGINDCFSAPPDDLKALDARIDGMFKHADVLLQAFRQAAPEAELGICITTPPNSRDASFQANYKDRYPRWGWKRIQHRLVQRQLERFAGKEDTKIFIIPTQLNLDPTDGYPANNGVHPNVRGYQQIGATIFASLKSRLVEPR